MTEIRRHFRQNDTIFLTHVTFERIPILITHFDLLWTPIERIERDSSLEIIAWVVLPDHFHLLVRSEMDDVSMLMKKIKLSFSTSYRKAAGWRDGRVWQYRFWDHIIRDEDDMNRHIDYIHFNPVKHGLALSPFEWQHSSIHDYLKDGYYDRD